MRQPKPHDRLPTVYARNPYQMLLGNPKFLDLMRHLV
ncbi:MAG: hypothetical protein ACJAX2_001350 [Celeribacter sp.]|jgi:hypothetical protein